MFIVNYYILENGLITLGVTIPADWDFEIQDGCNGGDACTYLACNSNGEVSFVYPGRAESVGADAIVPSLLSFIAECESQHFQSEDELARFAFGKTLSV